MNTFQSPLSRRGYGAAALSPCESQWEDVRKSHVKSMWGYPLFSAERKEYEKLAQHAAQMKKSCSSVATDAALFPEAEAEITDAEIAAFQFKEGGGVEKMRSSRPREGGRGADRGRRAVSKGTEGVAESGFPMPLILGGVGVAVLLVGFLVLRNRE